MRPRSPTSVTGAATMASARLTLGRIKGVDRPAILALLVFFVVGGLLLTRLDVRRGITQAGNAQPAVI